MLLGTRFGAWSTDGDVLISTKEQIDTCISDKEVGKRVKKKYVGIILVGRIQEV